MFLNTETVDLSELQILKFKKFQYFDMNPFLEKYRLLTIYVQSIVEKGL